MAWMLSAASFAMIARRAISEGVVNSRSAAASIPFLKEGGQRNVKRSEKRFAFDRSFISLLWVRTPRHCTKAQHTQSLDFRYPQADMRSLTLPHRIFLNSPRPSAGNPSLKNLHSETRLQASVVNINMRHHHPQRQECRDCLECRDCW